LTENFGKTDDYSKRCLIGETLRGRAHNYSRSHKNDDKIYIKDFNDMFNINMEKNKKKYITY